AAVGKLPQQITCVVSHLDTELEFVSIKYHRIIQIRDRLEYRPLADLENQRLDRSRGICQEPLLRISQIREVNNPIHNISNSIVRLDISSYDLVLGFQKLLYQEPLRRVY